MKIVIDKDLPNLTSEEIEEFEDAKEMTTEKMKGILLCAEEIHFTEEVANKIKAQGMTLDEFVALLLRNVGASQ